MNTDSNTTLDSDSDDEANICPICSRGFSSMAGVRIHWRIHSAEQIQAAINEKLATQNLTSTTRENATLNTVVTTTTEPEDFRCFECGVDAVNEQNYIAHLRSHLQSNNDTVPQLSSSNREFIEYISQLKQSYRIVKRIPKGARSVVADNIARLIDKCIASNATRDWRRLLLFAFKTLRLPDRKNDLSLVQIIKRNATETAELLPTLENNRVSSRKQCTLTSRIEAKLADFDIRGAVRLISSTDAIARECDETFTELENKHPEPSRPQNFPSDPDDSIQPLQVDSNMVHSAIMSFANGSSAGSDGLRPQHLKDIISMSAGESGNRALQSITKLNNFFLAGKLNDEVCELMYGASLCALQKKDGGLRPIAIGTTLRRLTSKIACFSVKSDMINYLRPRQIGFGVKFGCEAAVHAIRSYVRNPRNGCKLILKVDVKNAFNSVERDVMLAEIKDKIPQLYHYFSQCYLRPTFLAYGNKIILSRVGAQQGDPAGPLIFSLAIHPLVISLQAEFNVWYLDDGTLGDTPAKVLADLSTIKDTAKSIGLELNCAKCEIYFCNGPANDDVVSQFELLAPGIKVVTDDELEILGSPILESAIEPFTRRKFQKINVLIARLSSLQTHYALFILKNCMAIPKLVYLLRCSPLWKFTALLQDLDMQLKSALEHIINVQLTETQWIQSTLPVNFGGLGIRSFTDISLPAFLSSVYGVQDTVSTLTYIQDYESNMPYLMEALNKWNDVNNEPKPEILKSQFAWDRISVNRLISQLTFTSEVEQFRFDLLQNKMSGAWLNVIPSPNIGTFLNNDVMRICIGLRLGSKICHPFECVCGKAVDELGRHALHCKNNPGKYFRHAELNRILHQGLGTINMPSLLEPTGLYRDDRKKRPDGITYTAWERGKSLVWDATCADSLAVSNMSGRIKTPGMASERAVARKHSKYSLIKANYHFVAVGVETFGPWSKEAIILLNKIGSHMIRLTGEAKARHYLFQRFSLAIQRGNAMSVNACIPKGAALDEIYHLH